MTDPTAPNPTGAPASPPAGAAPAAGQAPPSTAGQASPTATPGQPGPAAAGAATEPTNAAPHAFDELPNGGVAPGGEAHLSVLYELDMPVSVELGRTSMSVRELLTLARGAVVQLDRLAGEPVDVFVGERKMAEGEVVVLGDHFGVRLTRVVATPTAAAAAP